MNSRRAGGQAYRPARGRPARRSSVILRRPRRQPTRADARVTQSAPRHQHVAGGARSGHTAAASCPARHLPTAAAAAAEAVAAAAALADAQPPPPKPRLLSAPDRDPRRTKQP